MAMDFVWKPMNGCKSPMTASLNKAPERYFTYIGQFFENRQGHHDSNGSRDGFEVNFSHKSFLENARHERQRSQGLPFKDLV